MRDTANTPGRTDHVGVSAKDLLDYATGEPVTQDEPVAHPSPITPEGIPLLMATALEMARAAYYEVLQQSELRVGQLRAQVRPEAASNARAAADRNLRNATHWQDVKDRVVVALAGRSTHTTYSARKALVLLVLLGVADMGLNAAAAIYGGDVPWLAVLSFTGIAAATVAVGWAAGDRLRRVGDALRVGPPDAEALELHLDLLFARPGDGKRLGYWLGVLGLSTVLIAFGVAVLRVQEGQPWIYGLFSAAVNLGAAYLAYISCDATGPVVDDLDRRVRAERGAAKQEEVVVDSAQAHEDEADAEEASAPLRARAQYRAVLAEALARLTRDAGTYGVLVDPELLEVLSPEHPDRAVDTPEAPAGRPTRIASRHPLIAVRTEVPAASPLHPAA